MRKPNKYLLFLLVTVMAYALVEYYRPRPIDWTPTYENDDRIPFGTQALFELLPSLMQQPAVKTVRLPVYNFLTETRPAGRSNYVFICRSFEADANDLRQLFRYVKQGNNCLISAYDMPDSLGKALGFKADLRTPDRADSSLRQNFVNPALKKPAGYRFSRDDGRNYLRINKTGGITVLGRNARQEPVFIRVQYGKGHFFIHNLPLAFTNYYLLNHPSSDYAIKALSYLPAWPTYWDEYQKQGRFDEDQQSILRYIWSQPALTWAYYLVVIGLLLYVIFAGKRTQRIIPVMEPPRNTSLDFVKDVGRLYFQQRDHDNMARKKVQYFLADLRERYGLNTNQLDHEFTETLARKSGLPTDQTAELVRLLRNAQKSVTLSEYDLLTLNGAIEKFNQTV
ncbi:MULTISPECIES: DUF4350 domain-containing protein [Spirosoma]|uniref:DUF4350 domain-containing protein n=1 Tax=Spirosoma sordidisoli TaxID=2502893 RepID=A0A4Q2ULX0_9BACT|nr:MULTISPECIES: DUF4350 domain-containing protein [Spirosoma]RYC68520.1 DUF4350 domain-containing protein [Spirosoma sordidisoli]